MNRIKYDKLINELNSRLMSSTRQISPTPGSDCGKAVTSVPLFITRDMDVEQLTDSQVYLTHALLHKFYARGGIKDLNKEDIEKLHNLIKVKMSHCDFDKLDDK